MILAVVLSHTIFFPYPEFSSTIAAPYTAWFQLVLFLCKTPKPEAKVFGRSLLLPFSESVKWVQEPIWGGEFCFFLRSINHFRTKGGVWRWWCFAWNGCFCILDFMLSRRWFRPQTPNPFWRSKWPWRWLLEETKTGVFRRLISLGEADNILLCISLSLSLANSRKKSLKKVLSLLFHQFACCNWAFKKNPL